MDEMDKIKIASELLRIAKGLVAGVTVTESNGEMIVTGPYMDMKDVYPSLKAWGFRYNGVDKSWRISLSKLTAEKREKVEALIGKRHEEKKQDDAGKLKKLEEKGKIRFDNFTVVITQSAIFVEGDTYPLSEMFHSMGAKWNGKQYELLVARMSEAEVDKLFDALEKRDKAASAEMREKLELVEKGIDKLKGKLVEKAVRVTVRDGVLSVSLGKERNSLVKDVFSYAQWDGYSWRISLRRAATSDLEKFFRGVEKLEEALKEQAQKGPVQTAPAAQSASIMFSLGSGYVRGGRLWFKDGDVIKSPASVEKEHGVKFIKILGIRSRYFREDGMSFGVGDDQGYVWSVSARPATDVESEPLLEEVAKKQSKASAMDELQGIAKKIRDDGHRPQKGEPKGSIIYLDSRGIIYGFGTWFVVGSSGIWYVQNNGSDGADWSLNNVLTGGAGAIGWVVPHSQELEDKIRQLAGIAGLEVR